MRGERGDTESSECVRVCACVLEVRFEGAGQEETRSHLRERCFVVNRPYISIDGQMCVCMCVVRSEHTAAQTAGMKTRNGYRLPPHTHMQCGAR